MSSNYAMSAALETEQAPIAAESCSEMEHSDTIQGLAEAILTCPCGDVGCGRCQRLAERLGELCLWWPIAAWYPLNP